MDFDTPPLPTQLACLIVIKIHNKYYMENSIIMLENKKSGASFEWSNKEKTRGRLLQQIPGYLPADFYP